MKTILTICLFLAVFTTQAQKRNTGYYSNDNKKNAGICLTVAGVAFTGAAILEGGSQYGTYVSTPNNTSKYNTTYVTPPFWKQTPRNIMLVVGVSLTITGLITAASHR